MQRNGCEPSKVVVYRKYWTPTGTESMDQWLPGTANSFILETYIALLQETTTTQRQVKGKTAQYLTGT